MLTEIPRGVSVVICCHNSTQQLPPTLAHVAAQKVKEGLQWEVIVVDNASTDWTSQVALDSWPLDPPAPMRVIYELKLGLSYARHRGLAEAKYEIVSFVDDDNWICPEWVQLVSEIMNQHPDVGACGGLNEAVCEIKPPWWFKKNKGSYGVGSQGQEAGEVSSARGFLYGAGLTIRKAAWLHLVSNRFRFLNIDRKGTSLSSGGDQELCLALRLAGWRLWYEPNLRLRHFLPAERLQWNYLCRLKRAFGAASVGLDPYRFVINCSPKMTREKLRQTWQWQTLRALLGLLWHSSKLISLLYSSREGNEEVINVGLRIGRLAELLRKRKAYQLSIRQIRNASWNATQKKR